MTSTIPNLLSRCHSAPIIEGGLDFPKYYVCTECGHRCDAKAIEPPPYTGPGPNMDVPTAAEAAHNRILHIAELMKPYHDCHYPPPAQRNEF